MSDFSSLKTSREARKPLATGSASTTTSSNNEAKSVTTSNEDGASSKPTTAVSEPVNVIASTSYSHIDLPKTIEVRTVEGRGRGLFTTKLIAPGTKILSTTPLISVLDNRSLSIRCSACFLAEEDMPEGKDLLQCSGCSTVKYCTATCQKSDWSAHKDECKALTAYAKARKGTGNKIPDTTIRALGRLLWAKASKGDKLSAEVDSMQSHTLTLPIEEQYFQISVSLASYVGQETVTKTCRSAVSLLELVSRFVSNSFTLTSPHLSSIGVTISPLPALLNHSCLPNCVVVFPSYSTPSNPKYLKVIAISNIQEGEELVTSYSDLALRGRERREELKERYLFDCACEVCLGVAVEGRVDAREALVCGEKGCDGLVPMPDLEEESGDLHDIKCRKCKFVHAVSKDSLRDATTKAIEVLKDAEAAQYTNPERASRDLLASIASLHYTSLAPSSYPYLPTLQTYLSILLHSQSFSLALPIAQQTYSALASIFPPGHPTRAAVAATIAKLLIITRDEGDEAGYWKNEQGVRENLNVLIAALGEVERGFGKNEGVVRDELRSLIRDAEEGLEMGSLSRSGQMNR